MQKGYDLYPSEYNFKCFTQLQSACSYPGKLQTNYAVLTFCDFNRRLYSLLLGYLQGRIAADILSICLLPIMVFYSLCR